MFLTDLKGLNVQNNSFKDLEGYLEEAENVVLSQDKILQKRLGYFTFFPAPALTPLGLTDYKSKLILIGSSYVRRIDQTVSGDYSSDTLLTGQSFTITYPRTAQAAGNLFTITDNFVLKLENTTNALLQSGVPRAPDLSYLPLGGGSVNDAPAGIHTPDTQIGYRVLFARKDVNKNLILGAPSELTSNQNVLYTPSSVGLASYTVTINYTAHGLALNDFVTIRQSNGTTGVPDGEYVVTNATNPNSFDISTAAVLTSPPSGVTSLKFGIRIKPKLEFTIPSFVDSTFLYRIYRSNASISNSVEPDESTLQLIEESNVSSADILNGYIQYTDSIDNLFKTTYLYTNPNTGEGILEANNQAPIARDIGLFKNHLFLAYPTTPYVMALNLIRSSASTFVNGDYVDLLQIDYSKTSTSALWQSGTTVRYAVSSTSNLQIGQYVNFTGFVNSANNGKFIITAINTLSIDCTNAGRTNNTLDESSATAVAYPIRRYTAASSNSYNTALGGNFLLSTGSASVATNIDSTARSLCKAINRDTYGTVYASYVSTSQTLPGQMYLYGRIITNNFALQASSATVGSNFDPTLPSTASDLSQVATNSVYPNGLFISKQDEFEAFPATSFLLAGSQDAAILRIVPLKNSLIILKEDGIYSLRGSNRSDFSIVPLDTTVFCNSPDSVVELNGFVYACTNVGVVQISETNVALVSREIEPLLTAVFGNSGFGVNTYACAIPDKRWYLLTTMKPNTLEAVTYCYDVIASAWTTWDKAFKRGVIKQSDQKHYVISLDNSILKIRKESTKLDYCDESAAVISISNVSSDKLSCDVVSPLPLNTGDIFVWGDTISRITEVSGSRVTFFNTVNFTSSDLPVHYKSIVSTFTFTPVGFDENALKQFSELTLHFRNQSCNLLSIGFISDNAEVSPADWESSLLSGGWGELPWGSFEWGLSETTAITYTTYSAEPIRIYIPVDCQLSTWLKLKCVHVNAGEQINLQGIGMVIRKISDRVSY